MALDCVEQTRQKVVVEAREWLGTPWHHQAYVKGVGCDCIGLIGGVGLAFDFDGAQEWKAMPDYHNYTPQADPKLLLAGCERFLDPADMRDLQLADILLMRFEFHPMHFALVTSIKPTVYVIHALMLSGRVVEHRLDEKWRTNVVRAHRYKGLG